MGLEGIVSKRLSSRHRSGRSLDLQSERARGAAGGGEGIEEMTVRRSLEGAFFSRNGGRFVWVHCSASSASLVQVRPMSSRMFCRRKSCSRSAICRHSAARSLHSAGVTMVATQDLSKSRQKNHALPSRGFRLRPHQVVRVTSPPGSRPGSPRDSQAHGNKRLASRSARRVVGWSARTSQ